MELLKLCRLYVIEQLGVGKGFRNETVRTENEWARALILESL